MTTVAGWLHSSHLPYVLRRQLLDDSLLPLLTGGFKFNQGQVHIQVRFKPLLQGLRSRYMALNQFLVNAMLVVKNTMAGYFQSLFNEELYMSNGQLAQAVIDTNFCISRVLGSVNVLVEGCPHA